MFLFADAEESGLRGAMLFAERHPLMKRVGLVVNLEARGVSGPSAMFETGADNAGLIRLYGAGGDQTFKLHVLSYLSGVRTSESMTKIREIAEGETDHVIREKALDYVLGR